MVLPLVEDLRRGINQVLGTNQVLMVLLWDRGNAGLVSTKADMYSFGVVLWELVTADYPRFGQQWYRAPRSASFLVHLEAWLALMSKD